MASSGRAGAAGAPRFMLVQVGERRLALPIERVGEVLPLGETSPVPLAPAWVRGITIVRGTVIPVIDAGLRLGGAPASAEGRVVLLAVDETGEQIGFLVDAVAGLAASTDAPVVDLQALLDPAASVD